MITSTSNAKIRHLVNLKKKRKLRDNEEVFLIEGIRMFRETPGKILREIYVTEAFYKKEKALIQAKEKEAGIQVEILADHVFAYAADTKTPQGILCVAAQMRYELEQVIAGDTPLLLVLDNLQDPGNLGTILRTGEGAGVTGIILSRDCVDIYNPKTIRSTMGSVYRMPFLYTEDLQEAISHIKGKGIACYAAHLEGACTYDEPDYRKACAFLIGNEGNGLRREIADLADQYIKIPMYGQVESLNAAIATSVLIFEAARQRRQG